MTLKKSKNFLRINFRSWPGHGAAAAQNASALVLTMFIMAGMLVVALSGAYVVTLGLRAGGVQAQSTRAYYAAEAGAERLLWELRQNGYVYGAPSETPLFTGTLTSGATYNVYFSSFPPLVFQSVGEYQNSRRSVEIRIGE
jgi:hypothetical protein